MFVVSLLVIGSLLLTAGAAPKETAPAPTPKAPVAPPAPVTTAPATKAETAPAPVTTAPATKETAISVSDAQKLYDTNCAFCHGPTRQGITGLGKPLTPESLSPLSDDEMRNVILKGRPNTAMLGWEGRLSLEQINALIQLLKRSSP